MEITGLIPHIEALIFASDRPLSALDITDLINSAFGFMEDKVPLDQVEAALEGITEKYNSEFYPFEVVQSGGGWQFLTKQDFHTTVAQLNGEKFLKRLSATALETLAIIAYKQPVTKGEIESIRGVSADYAIQKLLEKDLIVISGRNEKLPGHPLVYSTSKSFMDYFGINTPEDLPKIREVLAEQLVEPTALAEMDINDTVMEQAGDEQQLSVTENGQLITVEDVPVEEQSDTPNESAFQAEADTSVEPEDGQQNIADHEMENDAIDDEKKQVHEENPGNENSLNIKNEEEPEVNPSEDVIEQQEELLDDEKKEVHEENPGNEASDSGEDEEAEGKDDEDENQSNY